MKRFIIFLVLMMVVLVPLFGKYNILETMEDPSAWKIWGEEGAKFQLLTDSGRFNEALKINYKFGTAKGVWIQIEKECYQDFSRYNAIAFWVKGSGENANLELKIEDMDGSIYGKIFEGIGTVTNWKEMIIDFEKMNYFWGGDKLLDWKNIQKMCFTITKRRDLEGSILLDQVSLIKGLTKKVTAAVPQKQYYEVKKDKKKVEKCVEWVKSLQKPTGLIQSYVGEKEVYAWTYDQAIALIMFGRTDRPVADKIAKFYFDNQNKDGSWYDGFMATTGKAVTENKWIGSISWMIHALCDYINHGGKKEYYQAAKKAVEWVLAQKRSDGFYHDSTEGNLDIWWALQATGYQKEADELKENLLKYRWDEKTKRFVINPTDETIYLDLQTWGACFAKAAGVPEYGLYALAFAERELKCRTFDDNTTGLDGGGPYTVWFEGTLGYIVAGGANSDFYLSEVMKHVNEDGSIRHSHERYDAGTIWHTTMLHVAPACWLYFANTESPLLPGVCIAEKQK